MVSGIELFIVLFNNLAIFIALVAVYGYVLKRLKKSELYRRQSLLGISFGLFAIGCMHAKIPVYEGVIVDQRNAIIALCGAFGGPFSAFLSAALAGSYRLYLGGDGAFAGVVGVHLAAIGGVLVSRLQIGFNTWRNAALSAFIATLIILPGFLFVRDLQTGWALLQQMALPYGLAVGLGIFLVGLLLNREEERYQAELSFRESEARYRELVEGTEDLITAVDADGNFTFANHVATNMLGVSPQACLGRPFAEFVHPEDQARTSEFIANCLTAKKSHAKIENRQVNVLTGKVHTVLWSSAFHYDDAGNLTGIGSIARDISLLKQAEQEKKAIEEQLRHTQKMDAIGTLSGGIAHDFNNLLSAILGYAELAKKTVPNENPAAKRIQEVLNAGTRAKDLVAQILTFSRKVPSARVAVKIHTIIDETVTFLRATIPTSIKIETEIAPDCGYILADPTQIQQVLMNLCTNAAHAMEEQGGTLLIGAQTSDLCLIGQNKNTNKSCQRHIQLLVKDTGVGIEKTDLDQIFDPFFTTKNIGKGTGMGLAVVHGIVKGHDGTITVESEPNKGTTVKLLFPQIETPDIERSETDGSIPEGKENILIIDDIAAIAELTKNQLETFGYQGTVLTNSLEALELFRSNPETFDLVITDQTMPDMTGDQLTSELLKIRPDIPVIICTGFSTRIDAEKAKQLGIRAFLMKPIDSQELAKTVRETLDTPRAKSV